MVINPSGKEASFEYGGKLGEVVYKNGGDLKAEDGKLVVPAATAVFVREER